MGIRNIIDLRKALSVLAGFVLAFPGSGLAQDVESGLAAFKAGDYATALSEWRPLAAQGVAEAQFWLGFAHGTGNGVPRDDAKAIQLYRAAAEQGHDRSQFAIGMSYQLGLGVEQDSVTALMWFNIAATNGSEDAQEFRELLVRR